MEGENKSSIGSIIGTIIIIAIIILGGLYFWGKRIEENKSKADMLTGFTVPTEEASQATSSDEIGSIEADLNSVDLDKLSAETKLE